MLELKTIELTAENFRDYGHVISTSSALPTAQNSELTYWGKVSEFKIISPVSTGILLGHEREKVVKSFERHLKTPEMLVALEGESVICFAKPSAAGSDEITGIKAFTLKQGDAFVMNPGTWHWVAFPTNAEKCKFLVLFAEGTEACDLQIKDLPQEIKLVI